MPPYTESDWGRLDERVTSLEAGQRMIASGHVQLVNQMAEITVTLQNQDVLIAKNADALQSMTKAMNENTEMTRAIRDVVITARTGGKFMRWVAPTLVSVGIAIGVLKGWFLASTDWLHK